METKVIYKNETEVKDGLKGLKEAVKLASKTPIKNPSVLEVVKDIWRD